MPKKIYWTANRVNNIPPISNRSLFLFLIKNYLQTKNNNTFTVLFLCAYIKVNVGKINKYKYMDIFNSQKDEKRINFAA